MSQPSEQPEWASGGSAVITDPSSGKKALGWAVSEKPPAQYFNWWMNLVYQWVQYLAGLAGEAFTWTAAHIFSAAVTFNGAIGGASDAATTAQLNRLRGKNLCKVWAYISTDGSGGVSLHDGFNVASVAISFGVLTITFAQGMADTEYSVNVTPQTFSGGAAFFGNAHTKATGSIQVVLCDVFNGLGGGAGALVNFAAHAVSLSVQVFGKQ